MKKFYEIKNVVDSVKDVDTTSRKVKVVISRMGNKDLDNDIIQYGAFDKTIKERGPKGANLIWHLTDHCPELKSAVAKFSELYVEGKDLVGVSIIPNTSWGNDVLEFYRTGSINQHSIGFKTIKEQTINDDMDGEVNSITEVMLFEGSAVLWGANPMTPTLSVGKSISKEEYLSDLDKLNTELKSMLKFMKDGRATDETFEMVEMRIQQNMERQKQLTEIYSTQPANAVEPQLEGVIEVIKQFNQSLK